MEEKDKMIMTFRFFLVVAVAAVGSMAMAAPSVTVGDVKTGEPWSTITVAYTLSGVDADVDYKIAFDVTANGVTRGVTNAAAKLTDGTASKTIDTAMLFGKETVDTKAKVRVSLIAVKIKPELSGVQLWENGPYFAECNIGASKPEEYGYYFWWGDTVGYKRNAGDDRWVSVMDGKTSITFSGYVPPSDMLYGKDAEALAAFVDANGNLMSDYDAATAYLGVPWRMMTKAELEKLVDTSYCTWTWVTSYNGKSVCGYVVKGAKDPYKSNEVFFPAAGDGDGSYLSSPGSRGYYWSCTPDSDSSNFAWGLDFYSSKFRVVQCYRFSGFVVRPVREFAK